MLTSLSIARYPTQVSYDDAWSVLSNERQLLPNIESNNIMSRDVSISHLGTYLTIAADRENDITIARVFILFMMGHLWFQTANDTVPLGYLAVVADLDEAAEYDWGSAILVFLYHINHRTIETITWRHWLDSAVSELDDVLTASLLSQSARDAQRLQELTEENVTLRRHLDSVDDQLYAHDLHLRRGSDVQVVSLPHGGGARTRQGNCGSGLRTRGAGGPSGSSNKLFDPSEFPEEELSDVLQATFLSTFSAWFNPSSLRVLVAENAHFSVPIYRDRGQSIGFTDADIIVNQPIFDTGDREDDINIAYTFILFMIGYLWFQIANDTVPLEYLVAVADLDEAAKYYWGSTILVSLYHGLDTAVMTGGAITEFSQLLEYWFYKYCRVGHLIVNEESAREFKMLQELTDENVTLRMHLDSVDNQLYSHVGSVIGIEVGIEIGCGRGGLWEDEVDDVELLLLVPEFTIWGKRRGSHLCSAIGFGRDEVARE
ncbi:hypothetical protein GIB67_012792 [Kingdonia uniflora]|uniref:Aminotransferase-like plant mobile domain-containing protein n=1 Tax=Kingdonia uniflora TaxID=39325 RepID=A0A7J7NFD3_9MAGN|nr:hypothetical protein GIB67_012792 [Kingdonia uniflora]